MVGHVRSRAGQCRRRECPLVLGNFALPPAYSCHLHGALEAETDAAQVPLGPHGLRGGGGEQAGPRAPCALPHPPGTQSLAAARAIFWGSAGVLDLEAPVDACPDSPRGPLHIWRSLAGLGGDRCHPQGQGPEVAISLCPGCRARAPEPALHLQSGLVGKWERGLPKRRAARCCVSLCAKERGVQERVAVGLAGGPRPQGPSGEALPLPHPQTTSSSRDSRGWEGIRRKTARGTEQSRQGWPPGLYLLL